MKETKYTNEIKELMALQKISTTLYNEWKKNGRPGLDKDYLFDCRYHEANLLVAGIVSQLHAHGRITDDTNLVNYVNHEYFSSSIFDRYFDKDSDYSLILANVLVNQRKLDAVLSIAKKQGILC